MVPHNSVAVAHFLALLSISLPMTIGFMASSPLYQAYHSKASVFMTTSMEDNINALLENRFPKNDNNQRSSSGLPKLDSGRFKNALGALMLLPVLGGSGLFSSCTFS